MVRTGKNRRTGSLLLLILFALGLACLALPETAACGVATAWVRRYSGSGSEWNVPVAMAVDGQGNVYVTGESFKDDYLSEFLTIKYSPEGEELWVRRYNGPKNRDSGPAGMALDPQGNVYVTGWSGSHLATIKYSPDGEKLWVRRYNKPGNGWSEALAIVVDGQGNVYVTGDTFGKDTELDYVTIKYSPDGQELWVRGYQGPGIGAYGWDWPTGIAVDSQGNVYVTGVSDRSWKGVDSLTIKYSSDGVELWVRRYKGSGISDYYANAMALDVRGNVYITGDSNRGFQTIKYNPDGRRLWVRRYNGQNTLEQTAAMALDGQGNLCVTGTSRIWKSETDIIFNYATIKYSPTGRPIWINRYNGPENQSGARALAVDGQGGVYVTGNSKGSGTGYDFATIKYSSRGQPLWVQRYNGSVSKNDWAAAIKVDDQGNVFVTGASEGTGPGYDLVTIKYTPTP